MMAPIFPVMGFAPLIGAIVVFAIVTIPLVTILRRTGHSGWWVLLWFVPLVNLIFLWIFAYSRWPAIDRPYTT
jgi:hypothetical protein